MEIGRFVNHMTEPDEFCEHGNFKRLCFACDGETWADYLGRYSMKVAPVAAPIADILIKARERFGDAGAWLEAPEEGPKDA